MQKNHYVDIDEKDFHDYSPYTSMIIIPLLFLWQYLIELLF